MSRSEQARPKRSARDSGPRWSSPQGAEEERRERIKIRDRAPQEATQRMGLMGDEDPLALFGRASSYVIRVKGVLDARWAHWFDGLTLSADDAETTISRPTGDLAELHGLLSIHDLGLALIEARQVLTDTAERRRSR